MYPCTALVQSRFKNHRYMLLAQHKFWEVALTLVSAMSNDSSQRPCRKVLKLNSEKASSNRQIDPTLSTDQV